MTRRFFPALKIILIINFFVCSQSQGDSLRSALNAINRRQRDLSDYNNEYGFTLDHPDDVVFLQSSGFRPERYYDTGAFQPNYVDEDKYESNINKRLSSSFRERMEEDNDKQMLKATAQNIISNMERKGKYNYENEDYEDLLRELWDKYRRPLERNKNYPHEKRIVYQDIGYDPGTDRKQNAIYNVGYPYQYLSDDEDVNADDDGIYLSKPVRNRYYQKEKRRAAKKTMPMFAYNPYKQFQVKKRSSKYPGNAMAHQHKRSATKRQTDPKVEKELSNIFGDKPESTTTRTTVTVTTKPSNSSNPGHNKTALVSSTTQAPSTQKVQPSPVPSLSERPLQIKKKSVDWSDYWGLDKRKRSDSDDLDKEWLIENYHKSISMSNKKRNSETEPCKHDGNENSDGDNIPIQKIDDIDDKLQLMEDNIVDEALRYTGAHEGESNPKKLRKIKDRVMSHLAAAYSLEKMRKALGEYKSLLSDDEGATKQHRGDDYPLSEEKLAEKRSAIPRKQVVDKDRENNEDADNNVKCAEGDEDCFEQNYKTPTDVVESYLGTEECPVIDRACNDVTTGMGQHGKLFKNACVTYQMCLLCNNNSWFPPTRQCNSLFIGKAYDICRGNPSCQREAQRAIRYLLDVNRSLHAQSQAINDCELSCPDSDAVFDPNYR